MKGKVHEIQAEEEHFDNFTDPDDSTDDSTPFLGEISGNAKSYWSSKVEVDGNICEFKLGTGAEVTVIRDQDPIAQQMKFPEQSGSLRGAGSIKLQVTGRKRCILKVGGHIHEEEVYIIKDQASSLLGKRAQSTTSIERCISSHR